MRRLANRLEAVTAALGAVAQARTARDGAAETAKPIDRALAQAHPSELGRRAGCIGQAAVEGIHLGVCTAQASLELPAMPREQHDVHDRDEQEGDGRQDRQVAHRCFHEQLPGTTTAGSAAGHAVDCTICPVVKTHRLFGHRRGGVPCGG